MNVAAELASDHPTQSALSSTTTITVKLTVLTEVLHLRLGLGGGGALSAWYEPHGHVRVVSLLSSDGTPTEQRATATLLLNTGRHPCHVTRLLSSSTVIR